MDMHRPALCKWHDLVQFLRRRGTQAVRSNAENRAGQASNDLLRALHQPGEGIDIMDEAALPLDGSGSAKSGMGVEYRQQGERDTGLGAGSANARGHLGRIGIVRAVLVMMQIMELADPAEPSLQHFHVKLRRHRLDLLRRHRQGNAIHFGAPAPETVGARAACLGQTRHGSLEGMAVQIGHGGNQKAVALIACLDSRTRLHMPDA
jgi:hypothetical protein